MKTVNQNPVSNKARFTQVGTALAVAMLATSANAAIDIEPITTMIGEAVTAAVAIGIGFLGFVAGMAIYKKLRGAA